MSSSVLMEIWPWLAGVAYLLVVAVLRVLRAQRDAQIVVHDRIRESREIRKRYRKSVKERQAQLEV